nr:MAG TPA: hypothetical protein [Caudoviricetes sp.]
MVEYKNPTYDTTLLLTQGGRVAITLCLIETKPNVLQVYIIVLIIAIETLLSFIPM